MDGNASRTRSIAARLASGKTLHPVLSARMFTENVLKKNPIDGDPGSALVFQCGPVVGPRDEKSRTKRRTAASRECPPITPGEHGRDRRLRIDRPFLRKSAETASPQPFGVEGYGFPSRCPRFVPGGVVTGRRAAERGRGRNVSPRRVSISISIPAFFWAEDWSACRPPARAPFSLRFVIQRGLSGPFRPKPSLVGSRPHGAEGPRGLSHAHGA